MEVTTPVSGGVAEPSDTGSANAAPVQKKSFNPADYDPAEIEKFVESQKFKLKVNGKEKELTTAELKRLASISDAATERFQMASQKEKEAQEIKGALASKDPVAALKKMGMDSKEIKAVLENKLLEMIEEENLDPKDKELRDLKKRIAEQEEAEKRKKEEEELSTKQKELLRKQEEIESGIVDALTEAKLPKNPVILRQVIETMLGMSKKGVEISPKDAVKLVQKGFEEELTDLLPQLGMDFIKKVLGAKGLAALREESVAEVKKSSEPFPKRAAKPAQNAGKQAKGETEAVGMNDFFRNLRRR